MKTSTAERLKQIMGDRNLRQVDILKAAEPHCKRYGIRLGRNDLSQYVSGKVEPKQDKLTILGLALNVSEAWLMGFDVPMERSGPAAAPAAPARPRVISDAELSYALFGDAENVTEKDLDDVRRFAAFIKDKEPPKDDDK